MVRKVSKKIGWKKKRGAGSSSRIGWEREEGRSGIILLSKFQKNIVDLIVTLLHYTGDTVEPFIKVIMNC